MNIPKTHHIFFTASSLENMERTIQNCVGEQVFFIVQGAFSKKFYHIAQQLRKSCVTQKFPAQKGWSAESISIPITVETVCLIQNDTSTGGAIPIKEIYALTDTYPDKLVAIDIVSPVPYQAIDFGKIDVAFFSVQKGFGLPSGLGVLIVGPNAIVKANQLVVKGYSIGSYHSFLSLLESAKKNQTPETPNIFAIFLFNKVLHDIDAYGVEKMRKETDEKAKLLYDFFANDKDYSLYIQDSQFRSKTTLVIDTKGRTREIRAKLAEIGIIVSAGYGDNAGQHMRIANFPSQSQENVQQLIRCLKKK